MESEVLIKVDGLGKKFCKDLRKSLLYGLQDVSRSMVGLSSKEGLRDGEFWALRGIDFELKRGECLGLVGHNGAGKSTLLKVLNGLIKPDEGKVTMRGKISALIELGAGFNPVLTGRENIYNNASVLGFTKQEIDLKLNDIIAFSEIGEFIDSPVQSYSSGMKVRLGFSVAAQMEPDILIIDEVLAVGDLGFTLKCLNRIDELMETSAVIFVSHAMPMVSRICSHIMLMEKGREKYYGEDISVGITQYINNFQVDEKEQVVFKAGDYTQLVCAKLLNGITRKGVTSVDRLNDLVIKLVFETDKDIVSPTVSLVFFNEEQRPVALCKKVNVSEYSKVDDCGDKFRFEVNVVLPRIQFSAGRYSLVFLISKEDNSKPLLRVRNAIVFQVVSKNFIWQPFELEGEWGVTRKELVKEREKNKIFVIGFNKTGTTSIQVALQEFDILVGDQIEAELLMEDIFVQNYTSLLDYCEGAEAFQDVPFSKPNIYKILDEKFPGSKFVLTVRDNPDQWFNSLIYFHSKLWGRDGAIPTEEDLAKANYRGVGFPLKSIRYTYGDGEVYNREHYCSVYANHNNDVINYFKDRPQDLLVINVAKASSYKKLCEFIGEEPLRETFTWENKTKEINDSSN